MLFVSILLRIIKIQRQKTPTKYITNEINSPEHPRMEDFYMGVKRKKNSNSFHWLHISILLRIIKSNDKRRPEKNCERNQFPGTPLNGRLQGCKTRKKIRTSFLLLFVSILLRIIKSSDKRRHKINYEPNQFPRTPPNARFLYGG